jgi:hypothetical protein
MPATYEPIATTTLGSPQTTVTFSSISSAYTDLILVFAGSPTAGNVGNTISITFNSDTGTNYSRTFLLGDGTSASSGRSSSVAAYQPAGLFSNMNQIIQFQNYSNTTTFKTVIARSNIATSTVGNYVAATVGMWRSTAAINRIDFTTVAGTAVIDTGSTFTLYGIKAA